MDQVMRVVRQAGLRLTLSESLRALSITLGIAFAVLIAVRIAQQLGGLVVPWRNVAAAVFITALLSGIAWAFIRRSRPIAAARALDERADLREALSTALCVQDDRDPWSQLIVRSAAERASKVDVGKAIPIELPRLAPVPLAAGLALALIWFTVPRVDLWGAAAQRTAVMEEERRIQEVKAEFEQGKKKIEELLSQANVKIDEGEGDKEAAEREVPKTLEDMQRDAVRKLTDLTERLEQMRNGEKGQAMDAIKDRMGRLKSPGQGELNDLYRSMARGNFGDAKKDLETLAKKLNESSLSPEEKARLQKQLEQMSSQLSKLATDRGELAKSLERMGMDGRLAADPEALKQAIEEAAKNGLSDEQKAAMQKMLEQAMAQQQAGEMMGNMADAMAKMAKGAAEQGMSSEGMQGLEQLSEALSEMEMSQSDLDSLDAALSECRNQLAGQCKGLGEAMGGARAEGDPRLGEWREGESKITGLGSGFPGKGNGEGPPEEATDYVIEKKKADVKTGAGPIIGTKLVQGAQVRGESVAEFAAVAEASSQAASEALETMQVQREYHDAVKHYFGTLKEKVTAEQAAGTAPASGSPK